MSRALSAAFKAAAFAQETGKVLVVLITVSHEDDEEGPYHFSSDPTERLDDTSSGQPTYGTVSRGENYLYMDFELQLPPDQERAIPSARLTLDNVTRDLITLLRSFSTPAQFVIELVLADDPDVVEIAFPTLDLQLADWDAQQVELSVAADSLANEPYPADSFVPSWFPALFG